MLENDLENNKITDAFSEVDKRTGELVVLTPNRDNTVQPVALMRLGLFVPTLKSTNNRKNETTAVTDVTNELKLLSIVKSEGYEKIRIIGQRLDMDNDFKTWVGIIHAFAKYNVTSDKVTLPFVEFVKLCGIPSSRSSAKLRERLEASLIRIASNTIQFGTADKDELYVTHLVQSAKYSVKKDTVELQADPKLFELYQFDRKVLLQLRAINALARKESAQALYTFIESLPPNPAPISMARLRQRLNLTSRPITQNATVRRAMEQLKDIGYLDYNEVKRGNVVYFHIHYRRPKLKPADMPLKLPEILDDELELEEGLDGDDTTEQQGEMVMLSKAELKILEKIRKGKA